MSNKPTARFRHLPLGARFSYAGNEQLYVKVTPSTVADWDSSKQLENWDEKWVSQGVYSFGENLDEIVYVHVRDEIDLSDFDWPEPYASIQIDVNTGITVVDEPSHKTVEVYTRNQIEKLIAQGPTN